MKRLCCQGDYAKVYKVFFWAGATTDVITCQGGLDGNCVESFMKCNCDSTAPEQLVDSGKMISI
jgi:hypothetical protein